MEGILYALKQTGFYLAKDNVRIQEFKSRSGRVVYVTAAKDDPGLVFDPVIELKVRAAAIASGQEADEKFYHNSNMLAYNKRMNGGDSEIHYGVKVPFKSVAQIKSVLEVLA